MDTFTDSGSLYLTVDFDSWSRRSSWVMTTHQRTGLVSGYFMSLLKMGAFR